MRRTMLKSKVHRLTVTEACLHYEGSFTLDENLMESADLVPYERIEIYNINNGQRFSTYVIPGPRGGGDACINGAAARLGDKGDLIIVASYVDLEADEVEDFTPINVYVNADNTIRERVCGVVIAPFTPYSH
ncbi:MAG: aspartate 1-decarboxylase [Nitrospirota bacterium]|nr:aspartate 1-decarboxylase [Nitrospirota bacterium]